MSVEEDQHILKHDYIEQDALSIDDGILKNNDKRPNVDIISPQILCDNVDSAESGKLIACNSCIKHVTKTTDLETYWYRWYVLALYSVLSALSSISWNTWGPIESSSRASYGWSKGTISLLSDWGTITYLIVVLPAAYLLDVLGLRKATVLAGTLATLGIGLRCITTHKHKETSTILIHSGQIVMGLSGPIWTAAATALSSTWFPPTQRTTATAIGSLSNNLGSALSFILGPYLVDDIDKSGYKPGDKGYARALKKVSEQIMLYLYIQFAFSALLLFLLLVSFPAKPPKPPSATANTERVSFKDGLKKLLKNPQFQLIAFTYGISCGVLQAWAADLAINLKSFNITDQTAAMMGFWTTMAGVVSGILLGIMGDKLGALKLLIVLLLVVATASFSIFSLICMKIIPQSMALYYTSCICGGLTISASTPLFFELAVESSYPVAEGINTCFLTFSNNVYCTIFLSLPLIRGVGTEWMNWMVVGSCIACIPCMIVFKERYRRLEIDLTQSSEDESVGNCGQSGCQVST